MVIEIFTSYFDNLNVIPNSIVPVTICGKCTAFYTGIIIENSLLNIILGRNIYLLCYETPEKFYYRHLVRDWLNENLKTNYREL